MPKSLASILTSKDEVLSFSYKLMELGELRVRVLKFEDGKCKNIFVGIA